MSEEGRPIPYLQLSSSNSTGVSEKLRVYIQAGVHGDEPAGDEGALDFLGKLDADLPGPHPSSIRWTSESSLATLQTVLRISSATWLPTSIPTATI